MKNRNIKLFAFTALVAILACAAVAYAQQLSGQVQIDGSSTVYPVTEAVAEEFMAENPGVRVTVGFSGTGGGMKKFGAGETDISGASRPIKDSEADVCKAAGIGYIELPIAFDGLAVVISKDNDFVDYLSTDELKAIWEPGSTVKNWSQVRSGFPNLPIKLYGPGTDSGTFDYFTEAICGKGGASRADYTASEDDNVLVAGVAGEEGGLGYFGFAYYVENTDKLKVVPIQYNGKTVAPNEKTINDGSYAPLSRPIFIYVSTESVKRPEVQAFVEFYLENAGDLAAEVGYVALPDAIYAQAIDNFENRVSGSMYAGGAKPASLVAGLAGLN